MVTLADKVVFLSNPASYGGHTAHVGVRETHMSWIFLTDRRVYKLKKPVKYPFLDFSTLSKRRHYCSEELRLNRRLARETYISVTALSRDTAGGLQLDRAGRVVEWLVEMKRLPQTRMLNSLIVGQRVDEDEICRLATVLADFYAASPAEIADGDLYIQHFLNEQAVNRSVLLRPELGMSDVADRTLAASESLFRQVRPELEQRIRRGWVVEGHGDLRPEHVCLVEPLQVIDCLEFDRSMRLIDPYDEVNYLGMECEILGAPWARDLLLHVLRSRLPHRPSPSLMAYYGGFRALLRARLCLAHLLEPQVRRPQRWRPLAIRYIRMAARELSLVETEKVCDRLVAMQAPDRLSQ